MRNWFKRGLEKRDSSYTDALVAAITLGASGKASAFPTATAALEACVGFVGRAFAGAAVERCQRCRPLVGPAHVEHDRPDFDPQRRDRFLH